MSTQRLAAALTLAISTLVAFAPANAAIIVADTVINFSNSGANPSFPTGSYGGTFPGSFPVVAPLSHATDGLATTFVSLPTGSSITLGFSGGFVFDGPGLDLFVSEVGGSDELADIFISSDSGSSFTLLGQATTATVSGFDFANIGFIGNVNAVKVVGLDNLGGSPGFDLAFVQGLEGSVVINPTPVPVPVPEPASFALMAIGALSVAASRKRRARSQAAKQAAY